MAVIVRDDLKVILTTRSIVDSTNSLTARRHDHDRTIAAQFQADCETLIRRFLEKYRPSTLTLEFNDAFQDPVGYVRKIADFLGVPFNSQAVQLISLELRRF